MGQAYWEVEYVEDDTADVISTHAKLTKKQALERAANVFQGKAAAIKYWHENAPMGAILFDHTGKVVDMLGDVR